MNETIYDGNGQPFKGPTEGTSGTNGPRRGPKRRKPTNFTPKKKKRK
jgi:hypothetical protein